MKDGSEKKFYKLLWNVNWNVFRVIDYYESFQNDISFLKLVSNT